MNTPDTSSGSDGARPGATEVIRSEEQVQVHIVPVPRSVLRIRKVIVTEQRTVTVTVRREELRITEEPATTTTTGSEPHSDSDDDDDDDDDLVIVLHEERVDVRTRAVPVERVRVRRSRVRGTAPVTESVRREQVQVVRDDGHTTA